jgi:dienelactone hydrolase
MRRTGLSLLVLFSFLSASQGQEAGNSKAESDLAHRLRKVDGHVFPEASDQAKQLRRMLAEDVRAGLRAANQRETKAWRTVQNRMDWERFRDVRIQALRQSLGQFPAVPRDLKVRITPTLSGDGYRIDNLVFESRPGLVVTANLYRPEPARPAMPGILICHSHHNPKTQGELQDMGMTWARLGCLVLIMDQLGHGERRQHPFRDATSYPHPFAVGRQDYYFRHNLGMQLHLIGDSLIGWMVWDLGRGVDLLLTQPGIDKERIILLGAVAGGGDPAAVTAALDPRIRAAAPFNFGGPQPETTYPLPADAEDSFNYAGSGSWESTRDLRLSARDGFLPWVIVGAIAPRGLIYAHEFAWDRDRDPVWTRLMKIYEFEGAKDRLAETHGRGKVTGKPPESTHCNNIGSEHRRGIYPALQQWFGMPAPEQEARQRRPAQDLACLTPEVAAAFKTRPLYELAADLGAERAAAARARLAPLTAAARRNQLRQDWTRLLGDVEPQPATAVMPQPEPIKVGDVTVHRIALQIQPGVVVPLLLLVPPSKPAARPPVVVAVAQGGKAEFLKEHSRPIADLLQGGVAVCLPDLRGTGETRPGDARDRTSSATAISSSELMLGQTLVGSRLRDLRAVLRYLRSRGDLDAARIGLWGDSFAAANPEGRDLAVPLDAKKGPDLAEPLGGLLALLGALFEDDVRAVYAGGGLTGYESVLRSPFCYLPHDVIVPGALTVGDLCDVAAALAPRPLHLERLVDGLNRRTDADTLRKTYESTQEVYRAAGADKRLVIETAQTSAATFFLAEL